MAQTIPGGLGSQQITFTVTGNSAGNLAAAFADGVTHAPAVTSLSSGLGESTVAGALNLIQSSATSSYNLATGNQYTYAAVTSATRLTGSSAGGDTVLGGGFLGGSLSYTALGGDNSVTFDSGDNTYTGDSVGGNTISGGSGNDTINTGTGSNTIFAGVGSTQINMQDSSGSDIAALIAGTSVINADGVNDIVYATAAATPGTSASITGGSGQLNFVAGSSSNTLAVNIQGGSGVTHMFTGAGSNITFDNSTGTAVFIAGAGNETLNGAGAAGGFDFFGDTESADSATDHTSVTGGAGADYFSTGVGDELITAGSGGALFHINDFGHSTHVTISNLHAADYVNFAGLTVIEERSLLGTASVVSGGNLTVTLANGTTVEFLGVTTFTGHLI